VGSTLDYHGVTRCQLSWPDEEHIPDGHIVRTDVVDRGAAEAMCDLRRCLLERSHRVGRSAFSVVLEGLATSLHEHDHETDDWLAEQNRSDDRQCRYDVRGKLASECASQRAPDDATSRKR
jgi:hypothetical protein